jgi:hypothetical protein
VYRFKKKTKESKVKYAANQIAASNQILRKMYRYRFLSSLVFSFGLVSVVGANSEVGAGVGKIVAIYVVST